MKENIDNLANDNHQEKDEKEQIRSELSKLTYEKAINNITNRINLAKENGIDILADPPIQENLENIPVIPNDLGNVSIEYKRGNKNEPVMKYTKSSKGKRIDILTDSLYNTDHNYDYHFIPGVDQLTHHGSTLDGFGYRTMPQIDDELISSGLYTDYANEPNIPITSEYRNISTEEMNSLAPVINPMTAPTKERPFKALGRRPGSTMNRFGRNFSNLKPAHNPLAEMKVKNNIETSTRTQPIAPPPVTPNLQLDFKF